MYIKILFIVAVACSLLGWSCHNSPTQPVTGTIGLKAYDVGVVDVTLDVHFNSTARQYQIKLGSTVVASGISKKADTLVFIDSLLPEHAYTFRAVRLDSGIAVDSTAALAIHTMDTTSHNISWQVRQIGSFNDPCAMYDVAVMNDTCVYAVGMLRFTAPEGQADTIDAFAIWNGEAWALSQVYQPWYSSLLARELRSVVALSRTDVWAAGDHGIMHWDGVTWTSAVYFIADEPYPERTLSKIWGSSDTNIYVVGGTGIIYHYTAGGAKPLKTGTTLSYYDIYGVHDSTTNIDIIYAVAGDRFSGYDQAVFQIVHDSVTQVPITGINPRADLSSLWFKLNSIVYGVGGGLYYTMPPLSWQWLGGPSIITSNYSEAVRGTDRNDVFVVGDYGDLLHFNGVSWLNYKDVVGLTGGILYAISAKGNPIAAVGIANSEIAAAAIGTRN
jgi:hypothetical protein